ncbi:hypothetical protein VDGE_30109 [Verticillium dahliae]|uniref:Uncharacterized protein n=1 Tax=Verticillium dahliae TaxID=27337 RepID=A0A444S4L6_VERDA|nr:hypothetical protein VDGE_30109 [Verticillium dahliae]
MYMYVRWLASGVSTRCHPIYYRRNFTISQHKTASGPHSSFKLTHSTSPHAAFLTFVHSVPPALLRTSSIRVALDVYQSRRLWFSTPLTFRLSTASAFQVRFSPLISALFNQIHSFAPRLICTSVNALIIVGADTASSSRSVFLPTGIIDARPSAWTPRR